MSENAIKMNREVKCTVVSVLSWFAAAPILTAIAALILSSTGISYNTLGYVSSALSFVLGIISGAIVSRIEGSRKFLSGVISGAVLAVLLISFGYIATGDKISPSGIISVVTFTLSGTICGSILLPFRKKRSKKRKNTKKLT